MRKVINPLLQLLTISLAIYLGVIFFSPSTYASEPTATWNDTTPLSYIIASHVSFSYQNKIYVIGGSAVTGQSKFDVLSATVGLNGNLSTWESDSSPLPNALIFHSVAIKDKFVYVLGGKEENPGSVLGTVNKVYLGKVNDSGVITTWQLLTPLPKPLAAGAAVVSGNRIYFAGGFVNANSVSETSDAVYSAIINSDGTIGNWTTVGQLPVPNTSFGIVESGNHLIVVGGGTPNGIIGNAYTTLINPDGSLAGWQETSALPIPVARSGLIRVGSTLFSVGGHNTSFLDKVYYAQINQDGTLTPWTLSQNPLPQAVCCGGIAASNNYLYITGGFNGNYLNTVYFTKLNQSAILDVSLYKQTSSPWQDDVYDAANLWSPNKPTIYSWGCAMTSAAMVLNYHNINKLPSGITLDPGSLNAWLKTQPDGYIRNGLVNWLAISRLSKLAKQSGHNPEFGFDALEYRRSAGADKTQLTDDLENNIPGILQVPGHFVVAKGILADTFAINDPFHNRETLTDGYNNTFLNLGRFIPSNTDLSYIMLVFDKNLSASLKDSNGNTVGESFLQQPITDQDNQQSTSGDSLNVLYLPKPGSGNYSLMLTSLSTSDYNLDVYTYTDTGEVKKISLSGFISSNTPETFILQFDKENLDSQNTQKTITFTSTIQDINEALKLKLINKGLANSLTNLVKNAEKDTKRNNTRAAKIKLGITEEFLKSGKRFLVKEPAYQILLEDIRYLKNSL